MVATAVTSAFFSTTSQLPMKASMMLGGGGSESLGTSGLNYLSKPASSGGLKVKVNAESPPKINGPAVSYKASSGILKREEDGSSTQQRTFINQLPDCRRVDMLVDQFGLEQIVQDGLVFRQNFSIRSYEIGANGTTSIGTLMNHLQETSINSVKSAGLQHDGFGSTPEMAKRNLIWVTVKMRLLVDRYPSWGDVVQVDTWISRAGKNGLRRDWLICDSNTGETLARAKSMCVMMNKETRKLSKIPDEVRAEIKPYFLDCAPILEEDSRKLPKLDDDTADFVQTDLTPKWTDLDINQHVNNVKYIGWIIESAPPSIFETHELFSMTLEYRKECRKDSVLKSLTTVNGDASGGGGGSSLDIGGIECEHMLELENGSEILRGITEWRPRNANNNRDVDKIPAERS